MTEKINPLTDYKSHQYENISNVKSTDDVYVVSHFQQKTDNLTEAIKHLKNITELDFIDPSSHIIMKINHIEVFVGKGKRVRKLVLSVLSKILNFDLVVVVDLAYIKLPFLVSVGINGLILLF